MCNSIGVFLKLLNQSSRCIERAIPRQFFALLPLLFLCCFTSCDNNKTIVHDLSEREANEILVFLESKGVVADKQKAETTGAGQGEVKWDVVVASNRATLAMALLNEVGLPRKPGKSLLDIFEQSGLVPTEQQEQIKFRAGLEQEIANTIRKIDGVTDADVRLSFPKEDPLNIGAPKGKVTASVYVKHSGILDDPNSHLISKIREFVASSVNGLNFDDVTVVPDRTRTTDIFGGLNKGSKGSQELLNVWTLTIAKESITRFRIIFFTFIIAITFLLCLSLFLFWKLLPILSQSGGISKLFSLKPLTHQGEEEKTEKEDEEDSDEESTDKR